MKYLDVNNILCANIVIYVASQFFSPLKAAVSRILLKVVIGLNEPKYLSYFKLFMHV